MEEVSLCLLLSNLHLISLTQKRFILTQFVTLTWVLPASACPLVIVRHDNTENLQKYKQVTHM